MTAGTNSWIRTIHAPDERGVCRACGYDDDGAPNEYPCETLRALDGEVWPHCPHCHEPCGPRPGDLLDHMLSEHNGDMP